MTAAVAAVLLALFASLAVLSARADREWRRVCAEDPEAARRAVERRLGVAIERRGNW